jgi:CheY-like chemotaxis protein
VRVCIPIVRDFIIKRMYSIQYPFPRCIENLLNKICLIAEADPFLARLLERYAQESGLIPMRARVGQEVINLAVENQLGVIILDVELPGKLRGWQAVLELYKRPDLSKVPVITCCWTNRQEAHALIPAAVAHLQKPDIRYADFVAALKEAGAMGEGPTPLFDQTDILPG